MCKVEATCIVHREWLRVRLTLEHTDQLKRAIVEFKARIELTKPKYRWRWRSQVQENQDPYNTCRVHADRVRCWLRLHPKPLQSGTWVLKIIQRAWRHRKPTACRVEVYGGSLPLRAVQLAYARCVLIKLRECERIRRHGWSCKQQLVREPTGGI